MSERAAIDKLMGALDTVLRSNVLTAQAAAN